MVVGDDMTIRIPDEAGSKAVLDFCSSFDGVVDDADD